MLPLEDRELLTQTMVGLNIDPDTIASLMSSFDKAADGVESRPVPAVQSTAFGGSYTGGVRLGTNVELAHQTIADELKKMAAGLRGMADSVGDFAKDMERTTEQTQATMNRLQASTACVATPAFGSDQCSLPTGSED